METHIYGFLFNQNHLNHSFVLHNEKLYLYGDSTLDSQLKSVTHFLYVVHNPSTVYYLRKYYIYAIPFKQILGIFSRTGSATSF
jgi:hypothetical protein